MPYNWKCCSLYPNNFGASALFYTNFVPIIGYNTTSCYKTLQVGYIFQCLKTALEYQRVTEDGRVV